MNTTGTSFVAMLPGFTVPTLLRRLPKTGYIALLVVVQSRAGIALGTVLLAAAVRPG